MRKAIIDALIEDLYKIKVVNGYNTDIREVTTKIVYPEKFNYDRSPLIELFDISSKFTKYEDVHKIEINLGLIVHVKTAKSIGTQNLIEDSIELILGDIMKRFIDKGYELNCFLPGVESVEIIEILPYINDEENYGMLFVKLKIDYYY